MRKPAVAGTFYPDSEEELKKLLKSFDEDVPDIKTHAVSGVAPHAGYVYSGRVATHTYKAIRNTKPKTIVIIGPDHVGLATVNSEVAVYDSGNWETPMGSLEVDSNLANRLIEELPFAYTDKEAHRQEHSIEVQLPFIKYFIGNVKILPIMMGPQDMDLAIELGEKIADIADQNTVVIGSSDMSHYVPVDEGRKKDLWALEALVKMDAVEFYKRIASGVSACGYGPATAAMSFARRRGATEGELLAYSTSSDVTGDVLGVGYASVIFKSPVV